MTHNRTSGLAICWGANAVRRPGGYPLRQIAGLIAQRIGVQRGLVQEPPVGGFVLEAMPGRDRPYVSLKEETLLLQGSLTAKHFAFVPSPPVTTHRLRSIDPFGPARWRASVLLTRGVRGKRSFAGLPGRFAIEAIVQGPTGKSAQPGSKASSSSCDLTVSVRPSR